MRIYSTYTPSILGILLNIWQKTVIDIIVRIPFKTNHHTCYVGVRTKPAPYHFLEISWTYGYSENLIYVLQQCTIF